MVILHASWVPSHPDSVCPGGDGEGAETLPELGGRLVVWGESPERLGTRPRGRQGRYLRHPFQAPREELASALLALMQAGAGYAASNGLELHDPPRLKVGKMVVLLPSRGGRPEPSPLLLRETSRDRFQVPQNGHSAAQDETAAAQHPDIAEAARGRVNEAESVEVARSADGTHSMALYQVTGILLPAPDITSILAILPDDGDSRFLVGQTRVVLGADFCFWTKAAKLALELLARQRFVPGMERGTDQKNRSLRFRATWRAALHKAADSDRVRGLAQSMPGLCRAVVGLERAGKSEGAATPESAANATWSSARLLRSFLDTVIDETARCWLASERRRRLKMTPLDSQLGIPEMVMKTRARLYPASGWVYALGETDPSVEGPARELGNMCREIAGWAEEIRARGSANAFRTCFRLVPPVEESSGDNSTWTLEYLLQAVDDPSLLVPAARVWREPGRVLEFLGRQFESPQERLLADLGRASRLFPKIEQSLMTARPEACPLTTAEAYSFLREVSPVLEESGFGVLVPPWWDRTRGKTARLGVRLRVKGAPGAGASERSYFSMDSLVEYDWQIALGEQVMDREEFQRLVALKVPLVRVRGEWVELRPDDVEAAIKFWDDYRRTRGMSLRQALSAAFAGGDGDGDGRSGLPLLGVDADGWVGDLIQKLSAGEKVQELPAPPTFAGSLRPYQVRGYSWLSFLRKWGIGACLADDMGLGKTIQMIALLLHAKEAGELESPVLLVCPTSVVGNWRRELARFGPSLRVMIHHGLDRLSGNEFAGEAAKHDVVITTYALVHRDEEDLSRVRWEGIVLDEAQNIKNTGTRQSQSIRRLKAGFRVALTGTPVENRLSELWSIMDFLNPGYLGPAADFRRRFALPIERYRDQQKASRLRRLVQPFILRRLKTDPRVIQDLPEKQEMKVYCTLTREQATLYEAVVKDMLETIEEASGIERRGAILAALLKLKQVCNHPAQFLRDRSSLDGRSGKLMRLVQMLEEAVSEGDRALVFSQFAEMGAMLRDHLRKTLGREVVFLHGGVPQKARDEMVERFQNDPDGPPVFVLSLKAGGLGLNLTRANCVFHFDRWWNPAVENQATDRAFRIGQTRNVQVYKFICAGTLEERIDEMIESKKFLADNVIGAGEDWITEMSTDELRDLFMLRREMTVDED